MINGKYAEYVKEAVSNKKWVVAKKCQIKDKQDNYYIIRKDFDIANLDCSKSNCDSILQSSVIGPMNLSEFENKKQTLNLDLSFN